MSSSPIRGPSAQAGPLSSDESVELELLRERVGELLETVDSLEDALLDQRRRTKTAKDRARTERERAEQATERAENAHNDEAWWRVVYYQENYKLRAQVADLEEENVNLKGALRNPTSLQAAALRDDRRVRRDQVFQQLRCEFCHWPMTEACLIDCGHTFHTPCLLQKYQAVDAEFRRDGPREGTAPFQCPVCNELIKHRPICNLLVEHSTVYLPDESTGKTPDLGPKVEGTWAQLFPDCHGGRPGSLT
ncbi:hypothetical protein ARMSODRAFT_1028448 [Armillaria solidipes]|uniref:RING-type domain-containing protein n=1 Tax=Armillaria solidipes TaxID=1076256 RepID=A0A2H3B0Q8_9AGAR|nr:hypothetical protein ARMSODRAFT_1028448 [Armillaria solidipes]